MFSGLTVSQLEWLLAVVVIIALFYTARLFFYAIKQWSLELRERRRAPVRFRLGLHLRRWFNVTRWWKMSYWPETQATVRIAYPVSQFAPAIYRKIGPVDLGMGFYHPYRTQLLYWCEAWFLYQIEGRSYWGNFRFWLSYQNFGEVQALAKEAVGKEILIHYDPDYPEDALPVHRQFLDLPVCVNLWEL